MTATKDGNLNFTLIQPPVPVITTGESLPDPSRKAGVNVRGRRRVNFDGSSGLDVFIEGRLDKRSNRGISRALGFGWKTKYFLVMPAHREIRWFDKVVESRVGNMPFGKSRSIPFECIRDVKRDTGAGFRLELKLPIKYAASRFPREYEALAGDRSRNLGVENYEMQLRAASAKERNIWLQALEMCLADPTAAAARTAADPTKAVRSLAAQYAERDEEAAASPRADFGAVGAAVMTAQRLRR